MELHPTLDLLGSPSSRDSRVWSGTVGGELMYGWIWRKLPGGTPVKVAQCVLIAAVIVAVLFLVVFPWLTTRLPIDQVTV